MKTKVAIAAMFVAGAGAQGSLQADAIDDLEPGTWYEIPDSKMRAACPPDDGYEFSFHCQNVIAAWGGATLDTSRGRLLVFGGGHSDYKGNEVYAFDFASLAWSRVWGPTPNSQIPSGGTHETYDDGNPGSRHTYSGLAYVPPPVDALVSMGGSLWQSGSHASGTWSLSLGSLGWTRGADKPSDGFGDPSVYDPVTGHIFRRTNREMTEYDPATDSYQDRASEGGGFWKANVSAALDPEQRLMLLVGEGTLDEYRLDTDEYTLDVPLTGGDLSGTVGGGAPGLDFDTVQKRFVLWGGGRDLYTYDPAMRTLSLHPTTGADPGPVTASGGTFGRFRYIPSRNVFAVVNDVDQNVFVVRLAAGTGMPLPPVPDAGVGAGLDGGGVPGDNGAGGCGCSATAPFSQRPLGWLLLGLAIFIGRRRRRASADAYHSPVLAIEAHGSAAASASPRCSNSTE